jgi:hypothetical protein
LISQSNSYAAPHTLRAHGGRIGTRKNNKGATSMTALLIENLKLIILVLLIGTIVGLSHLSGGKAKPTRRKRHRDYAWPAWARL